MSARAMVPRPAARQQGHAPARPSRVRMIGRTIGRGIAYRAAMAGSRLSDRLISASLGPPQFPETRLGEEVEAVMRGTVGWLGELKLSFLGRRTRVERAVQERLAEETHEAQQLFEAVAEHVGEHRLRQLGVPKNFNLANHSHYKYWEDFLRPRLERDLGMVHYRLTPGLLADERSYDKIVADLKRRGVREESYRNVLQETPLDWAARAQFGQRSQEGQQPAAQRGRSARR